MNKLKLARELVDLIKREKEQEFQLRATRRLLREAEENFKSICTGVGMYHNDESGVQWATYPAGIDPDIIRQDWEYTLNRNWDAMSSGPGREFNHRAFIKYGRSRILVKQYFGLDI